MRTFYANGKLMLSGEYLVLYGATALVLPLRVGQHMKFTSSGHDNDSIISWKAHILSTPWFSADIRISNWSILSTNQNDVADRLIKIMQEAGRLNPALYGPDTVFDFFTDNGFDVQWGFGSSSALVANVARWAGVDPFELNFRTSGGSGADIAAALSEGPILYKLVRGKPDYCRVDFHPDFLDRLWLIYTGNKQNTGMSVQQFRRKESVSFQQIEQIDNLTRQFAEAGSLKTFMQIIKEHESIMSYILELPTAKESCFADFPGEIKSLGAWGGDFILAASEEKEQTIRDYFRKRNRQTVFSFDQIVLS